MQCSWRRIAIPGPATWITSCQRYAIQTPMFMYPELCLRVIFTRFLALYGHVDLLSTYFHYTCFTRSPLLETPSVTKIFLMCLYVTSQINFLMAV